MEDTKITITVKDASKTIIMKDGVVIEEDGEDLVVDKTKKKNFEKGGK